MNLKQLKLQVDVLKKVKEGQALSIKNEEKVHLDYITNYWDNIITEIEKEIGEKPVSFRLTIERS